MRHQPNHLQSPPDRVDSDRPPEFDWRRLSQPYQKIALDRDSDALPERTDSDPGRVDDLDLLILFTFDALELHAGGSPTVLARSANRLEVCPLAGRKFEAAEGPS